MNSRVNSPEHKSNILKPEYKYLNVGYKYDKNSQYKDY